MRHGRPRPPDPPARRVVGRRDGDRRARDGPARPRLQSPGHRGDRSFFAGTVTRVFVALLAAPIAGLTLSFGPAEFSSLIVPGLIASITLPSGSTLKALALIVLGLLLGTALGVLPGAGHVVASFVPTRRRSVPPPPPGVPQGRHRGRRRRRESPHNAAARTCLIPLLTPDPSPAGPTCPVSTPSSLGGPQDEAELGLGVQPPPRAERRGGVGRRLALAGGTGDRGAGGDDLPALPW